MRFEESLAALAAELSGAAAHAVGAGTTLTLASGLFQADAVASEALHVGEPSGAPVHGISVPVSGPPALTVTF